MLEGSNVLTPVAVLPSAWLLNGSSLMVSENKEIPSRQHKDKMHQLIVATVENTGTQHECSSEHCQIVEKDMTGKLLRLVTLRRELF
jgi:hypothetical protein